MDQNDKQLTPVRLTRKYAEKIDGVDLSQNQVGDLLDLSARDARMLIAEGWAAPCERGRSDEEVVATTVAEPRSRAADSES